MRMKFKNILVIVCSIFLGTGCNEFLDLVPEDDILTIPKIFETRTGAARWKNDACAGFKTYAVDLNWNPALAGADEYTAGDYARKGQGYISTLYIADGLQTALSPINDIWTYDGVYYYIRYCNTFLQYIGDVYNLRPGELERWTAEVKALKAFYYFELVKRYGPIVLVPQNIDVYAPQHLGKKDVLTINDKIVKIKDAGSISAEGFLSETEIINGEGLLLTPGFIDCHVHVLGGGGEGGFANRTPEATMEGLTKFGVTTVVGCLGTDGIGRDICALVAKTKGLNEQGMSAYCYTGSYQIPVRTLTDSIVKDIMMIQEIIGTGEIAISDHRSSQPTFEEFVRVVADTRLGGVLSGKAGIVNVHLGDSPRCLDLIERVVDETEIPASQILPTHINRNEMLFGKSIEYALKGGAVDFTGNEDIDYWETICDEVRVCNGIKRMLDAGVNPNRMTISSDGQGSLPMYSSDGEFLGMGVGQSSCLLKEVKECVFKTEIPLEIAISTITSNPADILRLKGKGKVEEGYDADLCILDQELQLVEVIAKGNTVYTK